ncbi:hypothetical protein C7S10_06670 [Nocardioides currus]|uniref:DUF3558 domain-containing protein n=2 Tax=Nocardioides currus TaxID=2133958 RepID=A0A2R7YZK2_9ACTN|nr:hypothetical protein C7S10_06670 [Nocardioides currus]
MVATAAILLVLAGCSSDSGGSERDEGPEASASSASPDQPAIDPEAVENLDPCSLVDRDTWMTFVPRAGRATARTDTQLVDRTLGATSVAGGGGLETDDYPKYGCEVSFEKGDGRATTALSWGWYLVDLPPQKVNRIVASAGGETHNQGFYAAVTSGDLLSSTAYGVLPPADGSWVAVAAPINSKARLAGEDDPLGTMDDRMLEVLDLVAASGDATPILLPEACPDPEDELITSVIGDVAQARGSDDGAGRTVCLYRNQEEDATLRLRMGSDPGVVSELADGTGTSGQDAFEGPDGTDGAAASAPSGLAAGYLVESAGSSYASASVEQQIAHQTPRVDEGALTSLLEAAYSIAAGTN